MAFYNLCTVRVFCSEILTSNLLIKNIKIVYIADGQNLMWTKHFAKLGNSLSLSGVLEEIKDMMITAEKNRDLQVEAKIFCGVL